MANIHQITADEILSFITQLCQEAVYDSDEGRWSFTSGGDCCVCTDSAMKVAIKFNGEVWGYFIGSDMNEESLTGYRKGGHDFAIVAGRYLVDVWAYQVSGEISQPLFDLRNCYEMAQVKKHYGKASSWERIQLSNNDVLRLTAKNNNGTSVYPCSLSAVQRPTSSPKRSGPR